MIRSLLHASAVAVEETVDVADKEVLRHVLGGVLELILLVIRHEQADATREAGYCET